MKISVILCTHNRRDYLAKALESFTAQALPESVDWEVLVVDNNSRDRTRELVEDFCRLRPLRFRYLFEAQQGKSHALNAGIREARGDVLAFTDDDVTVDPMWLQNLTAVLDRDEWAGSGGRTLPDRIFPRPRWLAQDGRDTLAPLALCDLGPEAHELTAAPFGNNMAFRRAVFEKYGGFRIDLGPRLGSSDPQKSEDSEFGTRLLRMGERLRYEPSAVVYHNVPLERVRKKYFLSWWLEKARADVRAFGMPSDTKWFIGGVPLYLLRRLGIWTLRWLVAVEPSRRFSCRIKTWALAGTIIECYRQSGAAK